MRISFLMNNSIQNNNFKKQSLQATNFKGIEKAATGIVEEIAQKPQKKDGFFTRTLNKYLHLDEHIANGLGKFSQTGFSKNLVDWTRKRTHGAARWCDIESFAITFFYMWNTWKSDKLDEDRKVPSMIQNGAVTIASSAAAALVDAAFDPFIDKIGVKYMELEKTNPGLIKEIGGRSAKDFHGAIKKLKSNTIFTAVVRFIIPVMMVPVVGKIVAKLNEKKKEQEKENKEAQAITAQTSQIQTPKPSENQQPSQISGVQPLAQPIQPQTTDTIDKDDDRDHDDHDDDDNDNKITDVVENKFKALFA